MTMEEVLKLVNAGYTKEEIAKMTDPEPSKNPPADPPADPEPLKDPPADPEPLKDPPADPEPPKNPSADPELEKRLSGIETVMNTLLKAVQANNLQNDSLNNPPADSLEKQTDDIMASIIRPTFEKRKDDK